jgi:uncharacterized protein (TIGR03435 family)
MTEARKASEEDQLRFVAVSIVEGARLNFDGLAGTIRAARMRPRTGELSAAFPVSGATPVVDQTGMTGKYDVELAIMDMDSSGGGDGSAPTPRPDIAHAYDWEAIGLEMKPIKVPMLSVVIDHIERSSEN